MKPINGQIVKDFLTTILWSGMLNEARPIGASSQSQLGGDPAERGDIPVRSIKMISLAAVAAVAAMAFVGASSAMAGPTQLCEAPAVNLACAEPTTSVHYEALDALLVTPNVEVECDALFSSTTVGPLGEPQLVTGNLTYSNCTVGCSAQQQSATTVIEVLKTASELAVVTGEGEVLVNCVGVLHCVYDGDGLEGHGLGGAVTGSGKGHVSFQEDNVSRAPGGLLLMLCPAEAELTALFVSLTKNYLAS